MSKKSVNVASIENSIRMLEQYLDTEDLKPLLSALEKLRADPSSQSCFAQLTEAFRELGMQQGAVLTYAPYIGILLSDDPYEINNFNILRDGDENR